jgi:hypothetical protein
MLPPTSATGVGTFTGWVGMDRPKPGGGWAGAPEALKTGDRLVEGDVGSL